MEMALFVKNGANALIRKNKGNCGTNVGLHVRPLCVGEKRKKKPSEMDRQRPW